MNTSRFLSIAISVIATLSATPTSHAATDSSSYDQYRRSVLGEALPYPAPEPGNAATLVRVPGPYAKYLMVNGVGDDEAVVAAERIGEHARFQRPSHARAAVPRDAIAAYEKALGSSNYAVKADDVRSGE